MIPFTNLTGDYLKYKSEYDRAAIETLESGHYILGKKLEKFEEEFRNYLGTKHCIGVNSGSDALYLALVSLGIGEGDEVIVPANTYIGTVLAITRAGAVPVLVEPDEYDNISTDKIGEKITDKTKCIMPVHLYGQACDMDKIMALAQTYGLKVVEDCAQSHGAPFKGKLTGTFGDIGCFSFYPTKNLGAFGDAGALVTDNQELAKKLVKLRNYGQKEKYYNEFIGFNTRMDEIQAALLSVKLRHFEEIKKERQGIAQRYLTGINNPNIQLPKIDSRGEHVWHQFVVKTDDRETFMRYMEDKDIGTGIHYPVPAHLSECYANEAFYHQSLPITEKLAKTVVSLPMYNGLEEADIDYVIETVNKYKR